MNWHLQDAKNHFSKVVQKARTEGPQTVTLRGKPAVVVVEAAEFERMRGRKRTLVDDILSSPPWGEEVEEEAARRSTARRPEIEF